MQNLKGLGTVRSRLAADGLGTVRARLASFLFWLEILLKIKSNEKYENLKIWLQTIT